MTRICGKSKRASGALLVSTQTESRVPALASSNSARMTGVARTKSPIASILTSSNPARLPLVDYEQDCQPLSNQLKNRSQEQRDHLSV